MFYILDNVKTKQKLALKTYVPFFKLYLSRLSRKKIFICLPFLCILFYLRPCLGWITSFGIFELSRIFIKNTQYYYTKNIILGIFLKETTYGWNHKVTVLVTEDDNHQLVLKWTTGKKTKQMDVNSIVNTKCASLNGKIFCFFY